MIVATQGTGDGPVTAITMLSGVEANPRLRQKASNPCSLRPGISWRLGAMLPHLNILRRTAAHFSQEHE